MSTPVYIAFEGAEGCGKSTQAGLLTGTLTDYGQFVVGSV